MSFDYDSLAGAVDSALTFMGRPAILRRKMPSGTGPAHNPDPAVEDDTPVTVVVGAYKTREVDGQRVLVNDRKVLLSAAGISPLTSDRLLIDGVEFAIIDVQTVEPGATTLLWKIQARK